MKPEKSKWPIFQYLNKILNHPFLFRLFFILTLAGISIPLALFLHKFIPDLNWRFNSDRILIILTPIIIIGILLYSFKKYLILATFIWLMLLSLGSFTNKYGFYSLIKDYRNLIYIILYNPHPEKILIPEFIPFPDKVKILDAVDYENRDLRKFAVKAATANFKEYKDHDKRLFIQCASIFKTINSEWNYINDPVSREYYEKASASAELLSGDCDDYSILMAASLLSIGATPRIIRTKTHMYPELLIGNEEDLEAINYLIKKELFPYESSGKSVHFHKEKNEIWLNMDYSGIYPGAEFLSDEIIGVLYFN